MTNTTKTSKTQTTPSKKYTQEQIDKFNKYLESLKDPSWTPNQ